MFTTNTVTMLISEIFYGILKNVILLYKLKFEFVCFDSNFQIFLLSLTATR